MRNALIVVDSPFTGGVEGLADMVRLKRLSFAAIVFLCLGFTSQARSEQTRFVTDMVGRKVALESKAERIITTVSVMPNCR